MVGSVSKPVLLSYAWGDDAHARWVALLGAALSEDGLDVRLDAWSAPDGDEYATWASRELQEAGHVLAICTPSWSAESVAPEGPVGAELWRAQVPHVRDLWTWPEGKILVVLAPGGEEKNVPSHLKGAPRFDLSGGSAEALRKLRTHLLGREPPAQPSNTTTASGGAPTPKGESKGVWAPPVNIGKGPSEFLENARALLVGVGKYQGLPALGPSIANDVGAIRSTLIDSRICAFNPANVRMLLEGEATAGAMRNALATLASDCKGPNETVIVYFSGHGYNDGKTVWLMPVDAQVKPGARVVPGLALSEDELAEALGRIRSRRLLVILDACYSGGMRTKGADADAKGEHGNALPARFREALARGQGRVVIASSLREQVSYVRPQGDFSLFTKHLVDGLRGGAANPDGMIRVMELYNYVHPRVLDEAAKLHAEPRQTAHFSGALSDNFVVAVNVPKLEKAAAAPAQWISPEPVVAQAAAPDEPPDEDRQAMLEGELSKLLLSLFSPDELRRFIRFGPKGGVLSAELDEGPVRPAAFSRDVASLVIKHGVGELRLFERLLESRPGRKRDLDRVMAMFPDVRGSVSASKGAAGSPESARSVPSEDPWKVEIYPTLRGLERTQLEEIIFLLDLHVAHLPMQGTTAQLSLAIVRMARDIPDGLTRARDAIASATGFAR